MTTMSPRLKELLADRTPLLGLPRLDNPELRALLLEWGISNQRAAP